MVPAEHPLVVRAVHVTASALGSRPPLPTWAPLLLPAVFSLASLLPWSSHSPCLLYEVCPFSLHPSFSQPSSSSVPHIQEMHLPGYMPFGSGSMLQYLTLASAVRWVYWGLHSSPYVYRIGGNHSAWLIWWWSLNKRIHEKHWKTLITISLLSS